MRLILDLGMPKRRHEVEHTHTNKWFNREPRVALDTTGKATKGTPWPKRGEEPVFLPPHWEEEGNAARKSRPVIAAKDRASFSNPHAAEEALKQRRTPKTRGDR